MTCKKCEEYRNGNTALIDALMGMVCQFAIDDPDKDVFRTSGLSALEDAFDVLVEAKMAKRADPFGRSVKLLWRRLEARKK